MDITQGSINFKKVYYYSSLVFAFGLPLSRAAVSFFVIFFILTWFIEGDLKNKFKNIWDNNLLKSILIFMIFIALSILWSNNLENAFNTLRLYSYWLVIFVLASSLEKKDILNIITAFLYGILLSELISYGVFFELWHINNATPSNPSPYMFWIDYSVFLAFTSILLLNRLFTKVYSLKVKLFIALFFISTTVNLFISQGRTGQVALIVAIIVMVILHLKINFKSFIITIVLLSSIYGFAYNLSATFKSRVDIGFQDVQKMQDYNFNSSLGIRVTYWLLTYDIFKQHPLVGVGIGDYQASVKKFLDKNSYNLSEETYDFMINNHAHNQFLMVIIQTGLIGLFLMLNIIYQIFKIEIADLEMKRLSVLFLTIYFVSCMAEPLWFKQFTLVLFILFTSIFLVSARDNTQLRKVQKQ